MLAIRMQRTGRKGHAHYRVIVQDARRTPTSGRVVANLGNYDPHTKAINLDKKTTAFYLEHGAQPSGRVVKLLKEQKVTLPDWVEQPKKLEGKLRNPEKLRRDRPVGAPEPANPEPTEEAPQKEETAADTPVEAEVAPVAEPTPEDTASEPVTEKPSEPEEPAEVPVEETPAS